MTSGLFLAFLLELNIQQFVMYLAIIWVTIVYLIIETLIVTHM